MFVQSEWGKRRESKEVKMMERKGVGSEGRSGLMGLLVKVAMVGMAMGVVMGSEGVVEGGGGEEAVDTCDTMVPEIRQENGWARNCDSEALPPSEYRIISLQLEQDYSEDLDYIENFHRVFCRLLPDGIPKPGPERTLGAEEKQMTYREEIPRLYLLNLVRRALQHAPYKASPVCISITNETAVPSHQVPLRRQLLRSKRQALDCVCYENGAVGLLSGGRQRPRLRLLQAPPSAPPSVYWARFHVLIKGIGVDTRALLDNINQLRQMDIKFQVELKTMVPRPIENAIASVGQGSQVFLTNCHHLNQSRLPPTCLSTDPNEGDYDAKLVVSGFGQVNCWTGLYDAVTWSPWPEPLNADPASVERLVVQLLESQGDVRVVCLTRSSPAIFTIRLRPKRGQSLRDEQVKGMGDKASIGGISISLGPVSAYAQTLNPPPFLTLTLLPLSLFTLILN